MNKRAISVTLDPTNLLWLKRRMKSRGARSVSETIDELVTEARAGGVASGIVRSVVGTVRIAEEDPQLMRANEDLREMFETSLAGKRSTRKRARPHRAGKRPRRG